MFSYKKDLSKIDKIPLLFMSCNSIDLKHQFSFQNKGRCVPSANEFKSIYIFFRLCLVNIVYTVSISSKNATGTHNELPLYTHNKFIHRLNLNNNLY